MYLVDTNIISLGSPVWKAAPTPLVSWMEENSGSLYLSAVTVAEIEDGIAKLRREKAGRKAEGLSAWLDALLHLYGERVLSFGLQEARIAGRLSDRARANRQSPGFADIIIAATGSAHNHHPHEKSAPFQTVGGEDDQSFRPSPLAAPG